MGVRKGGLKIRTSPPESFVFIDGDYLGISSETFRDIYSGLHVLKVCKLGYLSGEKQVRLIPDSTIEIKIDLEKISTDIEYAKVPAGEYTWSQNDEVRRIDYDFEISRFEITNSQYALFLEDILSNSDITATSRVVAGYYPGDERWISGNYVFVNLYLDDCHINYRKGHFFVEPGYENFPVTGVTWFGAYRFAQYHGGRLPSEEEWEKAARGNSGYDYPWGDEIDSSRANYYKSGDPFDDSPTPVGFYNGDEHDGFSTSDSKSPYGVYDMAGNLLEWTDSYFDKASLSKVTRGGSFCNSKVMMKSWFRKSNSPDVGYRYIGFRIVRRPKF